MLLQNGGIMSSAYFSQGIIFLRTTTSSLRQAIQERLNFRHADDRKCNFSCEKWLQTAIDIRRLCNCLQAMSYARVHKLTSVAHLVYLYIVGTEALPMADVFCAKASAKKYTAVGWKCVHLTGFHNFIPKPQAVKSPNPPRILHVTWKGLRCSNSTTRRSGGQN